MVVNPNVLDTDAQDDLIGFYRHLEKNVVRRMDASAKQL